MSSLQIFKIISSFLGGLSRLHTKLRTKIMMKPETTTIFFSEKTKQNKPRLPSKTITKKILLWIQINVRRIYLVIFWKKSFKFHQSIPLKNEYINPNVFLIMWLLMFEVDFKTFLNFTITHSLSKTFLTISKKQKKYPKLYFLAKFKRKKEQNLNKPLPPRFWANQIWGTSFLTISNG